MKWPKSKWQRVLIPLFTLIWWNRLWYEHPYAPGHWYRGYVYRVTGWRSAFIDEIGTGRKGTIFYFGREKR